MLIMNNTKVFPARIAAFRPDGVMLEILLVRHAEDNAWEVLSRGNYTGRLRVSDELQIELHAGENRPFHLSGRSHESHLEVRVHAIAAVHQAETGRI